MTGDFAIRLIGTVLFGLLGARLGVDSSTTLGLPVEVTSTIFALVGILVGLILTPWFTIYPLRFVRRTVTDTPAESLLTSLTGMSIGLLLGLLLAYPLSQLNSPLGNWLPAVVSVLCGYVGLSIFNTRAGEILGLLGNVSGSKRTFLTTGADRTILLDTSVLIDGRIVEIAKTGFLGGSLIAPQFVIRELQQIADSSDMLRRSRGRHGLEKLKELQRDGGVPFKIIEDDVVSIPEVDDKLVALASKMGATIITNDYPLNRIAETHGVMVLNVNALANAVRSMYLPGETLPIRVIQEGRDPNQGVGYLEDGTMVVVENGRQYMDRTITVKVTKMITRDTGRMFFAEPEKT